MRLFEIDNTIKYSSEFINPVTRLFTQPMIDSELFVDDESRAFKKMWHDPYKYYGNGGAFSFAHIGNELVGIGTIVVPKEGKIFNVPNHKQSYVMFGTVGFFVQEQYRQSGVANILAKQLENVFLNAFPQYHTEQYAPVVFCSRLACSIVDSQFKTVISNKELEKRLDATKEINI